MDRKILNTIIEKYEEGQSESKRLRGCLEETLEDVYEPYLIQEGYLNKTLRPTCHRRHEHLCAT